MPVRGATFDDSISPLTKGVARNALGVVRLAFRTGKTTP